MIWNHYRYHSNYNHNSGDKDCMVVKSINPSYVKLEQRRVYRHGTPSYLDLQARMDAIEYVFSICGASMTVILRGVSAIRVRFMVAV